MKILNIEPLTPSRVSEIVSLDQFCLGGFWTAEGYLREVESPNSSLFTLSIQGHGDEHQHKMIGMGCLWAIVEEAHITLLGVHPDYRRQGLGQLLLLILLKEAIARKLVWATLEVNVNNFDAIKLYKKFGFQVAGTRKKYYQGGDDALILWLKGIQQPDFKRSLALWQQNIENHLLDNHYIIQLESKLLI